MTRPMNRPQLIEGDPTERRTAWADAGLLAANPRRQADGTRVEILVDRCGNWFRKDGHRIGTLLGGMDPWTSSPADWTDSGRPGSGNDSRGGCDLVTFVIGATFEAFGITLEDQRLQTLATAWTARLTDVPTHAA